MEKSKDINVTGKSSISILAIESLFNSVGYKLDEVNNKQERLQRFADEFSKFARGQHGFWEALQDNAKYLPLKDQIRMVTVRSNGKSLSYFCWSYKKPVKN